ncbi:formimidoylglutamate deiminase [Nocardioides sp. GY 10113]|uniref:formimidoylglutamate deiminase n=1 Tax=Nocardioides sp. GY 10113 TaxID=2569761 RepID=UPI0010A8A93D|nr:formimidoylglutamate deiminase [Nocardioides sp. GY 10113]TIC80625.1 formimidoylglutamate deiminase [Nocardioides sp. GY 10113]
MTSYLLERAWVDGAMRDDVLVTVEDGVFTSVTPATSAEVSSGVTGSAMALTPGNPRSTGDSEARIPGLTLPGFKNTHSHAFHRALRGRVQVGEGSFWTWRDQMYDVANRLDPDSYHDLARATYAEMVAAGFTSVSEFHYVHHQPDGTPYDDPNALGHALVAAAADAGIRIRLIDTCYLAGGIGQPLGPLQRRFDDGDADRWAARMAEIEHDQVGGAIHSVRAVPRDQLATVADATHGRELHVHVSEQPAENEACLAAYGITPIGLLAEAGALGPRTTAVHATHLTDRDIELLAETDTEVSFCPTTERDLGDGIGPARALYEAGVRLSLGSDSQAIIDPFDEMRALEGHERLASIRRGRFTAGQLLGFGAGRIAVGEPADLVTVDPASPRTAGTGGDEHTAVYAAHPADVRRVMVGGRVVFDGDHAQVGADLDRAIGGLWR